MGVDPHSYSINGSSNDSQIEPVSDAKLNKSGNGSEFPSKINNIDESNSNSTKILPSFTMKKPFSEVVAGSSATRSGFPPLQSKLKPLSGSVSVNSVKEVENNISSVHETKDGIGNGNGNPFLQMGNNTGNLISKNDSSNQVVVYFGFEHECPRGHRFILTPEHLKGLGSIYAIDEESHNFSSVENVDHKGESQPPFNRHGKVNRHSNRTVRNQGRSKEVLSGSQGPDGMLHVSRLRKEQNGFVKSDYMNNNNIEGSLVSMNLDDDGNRFFGLLNRNIPLYLNCPHCQVHKNNKNDPPNVQFAGTISQLQRIFLVTPSFPVVLATCPVIQFEVSCLPPAVTKSEQKLQFSLGSPVILPPESFVSLRLPFVYGVELEDGSVFPLNPFESQPELTAWITKGTSLQIMSKGSNLEVL